MQESLSQLLFDDKAILVTEKIADYRESLFQEELALIPDAIEKRAREFSSGRYCAHLALHKLGVDGFPILKGQDREPLWPQNIVGSISHCHDMAGAAVSNKNNLRSLGLDIENIREINPQIARHVCTDAEKHWLDNLDITQRNLALLTIFSLKEAVFKCIYQANKEPLRFQQCQLIPSLANGSAEVNIKIPGLSLKPHHLRLGFYITKQHIWSSVYWMNIS